MQFLGIALQCLLLSPVTGVAGAAAAPAAINARIGAIQVERSFVGEGSAGDYEDQLVRFIVHLFDKDKTYLEDFHHNQIEILNQVDARNFQRKPTRGGNKRTQLRGFIKCSIKAIQPACDGAPHNSPIKIDCGGGNHLITWKASSMLWRWIRMQMYHI